ncbi:MAG: hypothetical protein ACXWLD_11180 [Rhizomicrobium sp.]
MTGVTVDEAVDLAALDEEPAPSQDNLERPRSKACSEFLDHWISIRSGRLIPSMVQFCQSGSAFAPASSIVELEDHLATVRFQGALLVERWGADITGYDLYSTFPHYYRVRALANLTKVVSRPCGYFGQNEITLPHRGRVESHFIQMPLISEDGRTTYVVHFASAEPVSPAVDENARYYRTRSTGWIDLGAGVPSKRPYLLDLSRPADR